MLEGKIMIKKKLLWESCRVLFLWCAATCLAETAKLPSGFEVDYESPQDARLGSDIVWAIDLSNPTSTTLTSRVVLDIDAISYNGRDTLGDVDLLFFTNVMSSGRSTTLEMVLPASTYGDWTGQTATFRFSTFVELLETSDSWASVDTVLLTQGTGFLTVVPGTTIQLGNSLTAAVDFLNPLARSLNNVEVQFSGGSGFGIQGEIVEDRIEIGSVAVGQSIVAATSFKGEEIGNHLVSAIILADELSEIRDSALITIRE